MSRAIKYAEDVLGGVITSGEPLRLACQRFISDLERVGRPDWPYVYVDEMADRMVSWFRWCVHVKANKLAQAGSPIILQPCQEFRFGNIMGWVDKETGFRRFRKAYNEEARKNCKSTEASGLGLYFLWADDEIGAEVYYAATKREQAYIAYGDAKAMAINSPRLRQRLKITDKYIRINTDYRPDAAAVMRPLSKDYKRLDGLNPHLWVIDEYHAHPDSGIYDIGWSGMGQRNQPLLYVITTAGEGMTSACHKERDYAMKVLRGSVTGLAAEQYFALIYSLDDGDDIHDPRNWIKANPILGASDAGLASLKAQHDDAYESGDPVKIREFLIKNLNVWLNASKDAYMPMDKWMACGIPKEEFLAAVRGRPCYVGVDMSRRQDLTSVAFIFNMPDGMVYVWEHTFIPEETLIQKMRTDKVPYDMWREGGWLTVTPGAVTDQRHISKYIEQMELEQGWVVEEVGYDPYDATTWALNEAERGRIVIEVRQGYPSLNGPTKDIRYKAMMKKLRHANDPVLNWAMDNAVCKTNPQGDIMLDKDASTDRIDPAGAVMTGNFRAYSAEVDAAECVYNSRGVIAI